MASTMQLEFSQAMTDFKTMFPDMDREVIEAVLRANQGAVDATIDQLLQMSTDNQNEKLRNELDGNISPSRSLLNTSDSAAERTTKESSQPATAQLIDMTVGDNAASAAAAANAVLLNLSSGLASGASPNHSNTGASPKLRPSQAAAAINNRSQANSTPQRSGRVHGSRRWNPPMLSPLPAGFLRLTSAPTASSIALPHDPSRDFDLPDEQFALMLQNEEFMNQLRWNQEFMNALEKEQCGKEKNDDDAAFKERLKNMGKLSRKKFLQMARVFTWQRNKKVTTAKQIDSLPLKEEPSDDEDHQHHHVSQEQQQSQHQQQTQHQQHNVRK